VCHFDAPFFVFGRKLQVEQCGRFVLAMWLCSSLWRRQGCWDNKAVSNSRL